MRILVISDIHANLNALEAVLAAAGEVDATWCLGDIVGYGPDPNECIEKICVLPSLTCLLGNHDAAALGRINLDAFNIEARQSIRWLQGELTPASIEFLKTLPEITVIDGVTLAHGSPRNPVWEYVLDVYTAALNLDFFSTQLCFVGHTHLPLVFISNPDPDLVNWKLLSDGETLKLDQRMIVNPGSVGQPRDHNPLAAYAIFNSEELSWEVHRVSYDVVSVQKRIRTANLPSRHAQRLTNGW